jgi:hypothetical protein
MIKSKDFIDFPIRLPTTGELTLVATQQGMV